PHLHRNRRLKRTWSRHLSRFRARRRQSSLGPTPRKDNAREASERETHVLIEEMGVGEQGGEEEEEEEEEEEKEGEGEGDGKRALFVETDVSDAES
ncbi:MAG: hypothetical protein M1835_003260, partial [Candelina submexicana]